MHCPGERCAPLLLPGPKFLPEFLPPCQARPELFANTCHPLSITKSPAPRWHGCPQGATALGPLVQQCLLLYPEPCETTRLLPRREGVPKVSGTPQPPPASERPRGDKKRVARSLPPCAPRCPEPGRLRFPPCGIRCSSASCRGQCRSHRADKSSWRCPELPSGYSLPLRGATECPPQQQGAARTFLQEYLAHRCSKGYPTQEFGTCFSSEQRLSSATECPQLQGVARECPQLQGLARVGKECPQLQGVARECPQLQGVARVGKECPQLQGVARVGKECPPLRAVAKGITKECPPLRAVSKPGSAPLEGSKGRSCSAQHLSRCRGAQPHPRGTPRPSRLAAAGPKRSGHARKSRGASKWLW